MRKDFDTGQKQLINRVSQVYTFGQRLTAVLLCLSMLGTLYLQKPTTVLANEVTETTASTTHQYPLSEVSDLDTTDVAAVPEVVETIDNDTTSSILETETATDNTDSNVLEVRQYTSDDEVTATSPNQSNATASSTTQNEVLNPAIATDNRTSTTTEPDLVSATNQAELGTGAAGHTSTDQVPQDVTGAADNLNTSTGSSTSTTEVIKSTPQPESNTSASTEVDQEKESDGKLDSDNETGSVVYAVVTDDQMMQFDRTRCTAVAGGAFYCQQSDTNNGTEETTISDGVHALSDRDGDLEIFLVREGDLTQLTFNTVDDAAPAYDPISNTVVWHRAIADRYQIMVYEFATETEQQLTNDQVNNMQPVRSGDHIAWQRWVDSNWQIMLHDGVRTQQLTYSNKHNIAPVIRGNYLLWKQQHSNTNQTVEVYDINTKQQYSINDPDGGAISNPRMMLLYESEFNNGDVVTRGLDLATNEIVPIQGSPIPLPEKIPNSEPLNEVRALVTKTLDEDDDENDGEPISTTTDAKSATSTAPGDLVVTDVASTSVTTTNIDSTIAGTSTDSTASTTLDLRTPDNQDHVTEYDVFVPPYASSTASSSTATTVAAEIAISTTTEPVKTD